MKTIRSLICACVLLIAGTCFAFRSGQFVRVTDVTSPYYLQTGLVAAVVDAGLPSEVDTVRINGSLEYVEFTPTQLVSGLPSFSPRK